MLEKLIEAGIELHNIVDKESSMVGYEWACEQWREALQEFRAAQAEQTDDEVPMPRIF